MIVLYVGASSQFGFFVHATSSVCQEKAKLQQKVQTSYVQPKLTYMGKKRMNLNSRATVENGANEKNIYKHSCNLS